MADILIPKNNYFKNEKFNDSKTDRGAALIFTILVTVVIISITTTMAAIFLPKIKQSGEIKRSVEAFYAADTGIEHCLYVNRIGPAPTPTFNNGATYTVTPADCSSPPFKTIGSFQGVVRSLKVNF